MLNIDVAKLDQTWEVQKKFLKDGFIAGSIWETGTGLSISSDNDIPEATALFNMLTGSLHDTLEASGFPSLGKYYLLNLEEDKLFIIIRHGDDLLQGMLLNPKKINMGILFNVAIPKAIASVQDAR